MEKLNELVSLQIQIKALRIQDNLVNENFPEKIEKDIEPVTRRITVASRVVTRALMVNSEENNNTLTKLNNKLLDLMKDRGILASYSIPLLAKITNPEHTNV